MSLLDWNGIEAAFAAMAPLPTEEREAAVRGSALTSAELDELRTLLAAHDSERRIPRLYPSGLEPGDIVGAYRIRAAIGRGGMGTVHLADRIYGFSQRVAIKTINSASPAAIQRFETERRALAGLGHPNIVSLIDAGVGPGNVPYLVMERVEGLPITEHCRAQHLTLSARLRLLARVAGAVHHAHLRGVLHRDLKPSNVLVTQDGAPKILDFGIAKVLDSSGPPGGGTASARTVPLTLNYASPEQIRALTATERSDVFGLGIVAYEAIAGVRPRELEGLPLDDVLALALAAPAPPSTRAAGATPAYAACALPPEVDEVILRAISVNPDDRQQSAIALKEDLERLATEVEVQSAHCAPAVTPRPEFRRRSVVAGMAAAALLLVAAAGLSSWWPNRPGNARVVLPLEESSPAQTPLVPDATHTDTDPAAGRPELVPEELNPDRGTMAEQADSLRDQATAALQTGQRARAAGLMARCVDLRRMILAVRPSLQDQLKLAWSLSFLSRIHLGSGDPALAMEPALEAVRMVEGIGVADPLHAVDFAYHLETLARVRWRLEARHTACDTFDRAERILTSAVARLSRVPQRAQSLRASMQPFLADCAK